MKSYEELLKNAKESLPDVNKESVRLEIPKPYVVYAGRQTIVKNFGDIARVVRRDTKHFAKFLFKELGVPGALSGSELSLSGKIYASIIEQRINEYVELYVMCHECGRPDTSITKADKVFIMKCEACGAKRSVAGV